MKKFVIILFAILAILTSCQDELTPCYEYNPDDHLATDKIDFVLTLEIINQIRTEYCEYETEDGVGVFQYTDHLNLPEFSWDANLYKAAQLQSIYMYETGDFEHIWCDGTSPKDRVILIGGKHNVVGENIAWGFRDERKVIQAWLNSEGHRKNILNKDFNVFAVAKKDTYWTMVFGYRP